VTLECCNFLGLIPVHQCSLINLFFISSSGSDAWVCSCGGLAGQGTGREDNTVSDSSIKMCDWRPIRKIRWNSLSGRRLWMTLLLCSLILSPWYGIQFTRDVCGQNDFAHFTQVLYVAKDLRYESSFLVTTLGSYHRIIFCIIPWSPISWNIDPETQVREWWRFALLRASVVLWVGFWYPLFKKPMCIRSCWFVP
jgi:hypothetical protein